MTGDDIMAALENRSVQINIGRRHWVSRTVNAALDLAARELGCPKRDLHCSSADPVYFGRMVWVWAGDFDADTAASFFVPDGLYRRWCQHRGACQLR
jgi:hypothetical protein